MYTSIDIIIFTAKTTFGRRICPALLIRRNDIIYTQHVFGIEVKKKPFSPDFRLGNIMAYYVKSSGGGGGGEGRLKFKMHETYNVYKYMYV